MSNLTYRVRISAFKAKILVYQIVFKNETKTKRRFYFSLLWFSVEVKHIIL